MVKPYLEDEEKAQMIGNKIGQYLRECIDIREEYNQEQKNLKALASKKQKQKKIYLANIIILIMNIFPHYIIIINY